MLWIVTHGAELVISSSLVGGIIRGDVGNVYLCGARLVAIAFATVAALVEILAVALLYAGSSLGFHQSEFGFMYSVLANAIGD